MRLMISTNRIFKNSFHIKTSRPGQVKVREEINSDCISRKNINPLKLEYFVFKFNVIRSSLVAREER